MPYSADGVIRMYQRLRDLREDRDWTQKELAVMLGMSQTGYSKYETGENDIPTSILLKLADIYGIDHGRVFAVGDGANDVTMLGAAAVGFVPENGDAYAKSAGDVIVSSNDDFAVADAIARIEKII